MHLRIDTNAEQKRGLPRGVLVSLCRLFSMQAVACFVGENVAVVFSLERQMSLSVFQFLRCRTVEKW